MVEVSRDGRRVYVTNSLYGAWDDQFYPDGVGALDGQAGRRPEAAASTLDERFFPHGDEFRGRRVHQVRLQGGDASPTRTASREPGRTQLARPGRRSAPSTGSTRHGLAVRGRARACRSAAARRCCGRCRRSRPATLASVAVVAALVDAARSVTASTALRRSAAAWCWSASALWRLLSQRHFRWAGMRLSAGAARPAGRS